MEPVSYRPSLLVTSCFVTAVSTFVTVIATPGTTAPDESVTVPRTSPEFVFCATLKAAVQARRQKASVKRYVVVMNASAIDAVLLCASEAWPANWVAPTGSKSAIPPAAFDRRQAARQTLALMRTAGQ